MSSSRPWQTTTYHIIRGCLLSRSQLHSHMAWQASDQNKADVILLSTHLHWLLLTKVGHVKNCICFSTVNCAAFENRHITKMTRPFTWIISVWSSDDQLVVLISLLEVLFQEAHLDDMCIKMQFDHGQITSSSFDDIHVIPCERSASLHAIKQHRPYS